MYMSCVSPCTLEGNVVRSTRPARTSPPSDSVSATLPKAIKIDANRTSLALEPRGAVML